MEGIIKLLPGHVANQIAAGEVVQRPASAVKELLENAIDAGADKIELIIVDAGKSLLQVVDNGCGMSDIDARMSLERHATSKITTANDLYSVCTLGFRGEALASIAAVSHLEIKTRRKEDEMGTFLRVEGSKITVQEPCVQEHGTSIAVKNLFYNIPARRNFLKSERIERKHILEEFFRIAIAWPEINFRLIENNSDLYNLPAANSKQRIVHLFGNHYNSKLVPVEQTSSLLKISGFIGKPEAARKTRGEQYLFVNQRFIKDPYLNHAIINAFKDLIPENAFPAYFIFFDINPASIDVNIHPTKTEVNFQDHQSIYAMLLSAIKKALGEHSLTPTLNFDTEKGFKDYYPKDKPIQQPTITIDPDYNPFDSKKRPEKFPFDNEFSQRADPAGWEKLFDNHDKASNILSGNIPLQNGSNDHDEHTLTNLTKESPKFFQFQKKYIITGIKSGLVIIDQMLAHQRILYERFIREIGDKSSASQKLLFPITVNIAPNDIPILEEITTQLEALGFQWDVTQHGEIEISGKPAIITDTAITTLFESIIEAWKNGTEGGHDEAQTRIAKQMAQKLAVPHGMILEESEMSLLIDQLFSCAYSEYAPNGEKIFTIIGFDVLHEMFLNDHNKNKE